MAPRALLCAVLCLSLLLRWWATGAAGWGVAVLVRRDAAGRATPPTAISNSQGEGGASTRAAGSLSLPPPLSLSLSPAFARAGGGAAGGYEDGRGRWASVRFTQVEKVDDGKSGGKARSAAWEKEGREAGRGATGSEGHEGHEAAHSALKSRWSDGSDAREMGRHTHSPASQSQRTGGKDQELVELLATIKQPRPQRVLPPVENQRDSSSTSSLTGQSTGTRVSEGLAADETAALSIVYATNRLVHGGAIEQWTMGEGATSALSTEETLEAVAPGRTRPGARFCTYRLQVSAVRDRASPTYAGVQLAEFRLYSGMRRVRLTAASKRPDGGSVEHPPSHAVDGSLFTKWVDAAILGQGSTATRGTGARQSSFLEVSLSALEVAKVQMGGQPPLVTAYELVTTEHSPESDPVAFALWGWRPEKVEHCSRGTSGSNESKLGRWQLVDEQRLHAGVRPSRLSTLGRFDVGLDDPVPSLSATIPGISPSWEGEPSPVLHLGEPPPHELGLVPPRWPTGESGREDGTGVMTGAGMPLIPPLELYDGVGGAAAVWSNFVASLGGMEGAAWAMRASPSVAAIEVCTEPALRGACRRLIPPPGNAVVALVPEGMRSLRLEWVRETALLFAPYSSDNSRPVLPLRLPRRVRRLEGLGPGASTLCLSAGIAGAVVYPKPDFRGEARLIWRRSGRLRDNRRGISGGGDKAREVQERNLACAQLSGAVGSVELVLVDEVVIVSTAGLPRVRGARDSAEVGLDRYDGLHCEAAGKCVANGAQTAGVPGDVALGGGAMDVQRVSAGPHRTTRRVLCVGHGLASAHIYSLPAWRGEMVHTVHGGVCSEFSCGKCTMLDGTSLQLVRVDAAATPLPRQRRLIPPSGAVLPLRVPRSSPHGLAPHLQRGARGYFMAYNPTLVAFGPNDDALLLRYSNYNFCPHLPPKLTFDDNVRAAHGAILSFVGVLRLAFAAESTKWRVVKAIDGHADWALWPEAIAAFPVDEGRRVSGAEDPRAVMRRGAVLLLVSLWESRRSQWPYILLLPPPATAPGASRQTARVDSSPIRLEVSRATSRRLVGWLPHLDHDFELQPREKNWAPFVLDGNVYLEYSLEPRLVLALNEASGVATPLLPLSTSEAASAWVRKLGPVSGGAPAVHLPGEGLFIGLAHVKLHRKKGSRSATHEMVYKHFWYAFEAAPPFRLLGVSRPFTLPSQLNRTAPSVQFATGLKLVHPSSGRELAGSLLVASYGEMDCVATLASFDLVAVLASVMSRANARGASPLLRLLVLSHTDTGSVEQLNRLLPLLRQAVANSTSPHIETSHLSHALTVALTGGCDASHSNLPHLLEAELAALPARLVCLDCSLHHARSRCTGEVDEIWAERLLRELACEIAPSAASRQRLRGSKDLALIGKARRASRAALVSEVQGLLRGATVLDDAVTLRVCIALCGCFYEPLPLCDCAPSAGEQTRLSTTPAESAVGIFRSGLFQAAILVTSHNDAAGALAQPDPFNRTSALPATDDAHVSAAWQRRHSNFQMGAGLWREGERPTVLVASVSSEFNASAFAAHSLLGASDILLAPSRSLARQVSRITGTRVASTSDNPARILALIEEHAVRNVQRASSAGC